MRLLYWAMAVMPLAYAAPVPPQDNTPTGKSTTEAKAGGQGSGGVPIHAPIHIPVNVCSVAGLVEPGQNEDASKLRELCGGLAGNILGRSGTLSGQNGGASKH